jgi:hypothetical protein
MLHLNYKYNNKFSHKRAMLSGGVRPSECQLVAISVQILGLNQMELSHRPPM